MTFLEATLALAVALHTAFYAAEEISRTAIVDFSSPQFIATEEMLVEHGGDKPIEIKAIHDILELDEEGIFKFLRDEPYLNSAIFNSRVVERKGQAPYYHDHMEREYYRIDPRVFLIPGETVRKWFYTCGSGYWVMSPEEYEQTDKATLKPELFSKYFTFPETVEERSAYYRTHAVSFLTQEMIRDTLSVARKIIAQTTPEDRVIIFGNTPYFIGRALDHLISLSDTPAPKVIYLPFSGAPNIRSARNAGGWHKDMVTAERLEHFKGRLTQAGLMADNKEMLKGTTYIVDVIGGGSGPSFTMETILRDFQEKASEAVPNFEVISINRFVKDEERHHMIASKFAEDGEHLELSFPSKEHPKFKVPAQVMYLPGHVALDFVPDKCMATRIVPKYNPCFWSSEYDYLLEAPVSSIGQILLDHFDENLKALTEK